jgi:hypothetical protein
MSRSGPPPAVVQPRTSGADDRRTSPTRSPKNTVWVPDAPFLMGSEDFYPRNAPSTDAPPGGCGWTTTRSPTPSSQLRQGHRPPHHRRNRAPLRGRPDASEDQLVPGSLLFTQPEHPVPLDDFRCGGRGSPAHSGATPKGPAPPFTAANGTRWSTSATPTPRRTRPGPGRNCPPRPSGSTPPAAGSTARRTPGEARQRCGARSWRTPGNHLGFRGVLRDSSS